MFYNRVAEPSNRRRLEPVYRELLSALSGDVIEIGAGGGATFAHYPEGARVTAFEPDPFMLEAARQKARPNIDLRQASGEQIPVGDATFDAAVTSLVLCTVTGVSQTLGEIRRALRPGGSYVFIEHVRPSGVFGTFTDITQPVYGWFAGGCHWNRDTERSLKEAGFVFEHIRRKSLSGIPLIYGVARIP